MDHQGINIPATDFRWIGPFIIEEVLPNNNYLVRKIGTNKTQVLHQKRLRQFTPHQSIPERQITPREWKPDPDFLIKHDDLCARARECEYEKPKFENDCNNMVTPKSPEITVLFERAAAEINTTPGTI